MECRGGVKPNFSLSKDKSKPASSQVAIAPEQWPAYVITDGTLMVTTPEGAEARADTRIYHVKHLPKPTRDLVQAILKTVAPHSWNRLGGPGSIAGNYESKSLTVKQTQRVHEQIAALLKSLAVDE